MDPEVKRKWIKALRSGEYPQGRGKLRDKTGGLCCLGVLCEALEVNYVDSHAVPPKEALDKAGWDGTHMSDLVELNDTQRQSFEEIAGYIEVNL